MRTNCLILFCLALGLKSIYAQRPFGVSPLVILRTPNVSIRDDGGLFVADQFLQRLTYGIGAEFGLSKRLAIRSGVQRVFFVSDVNYWFPGQGNFFFSKSQPITGVQIPVALDFHLIHDHSSSRWRLGFTGGTSLQLIEKAKGTGFGAVLSFDRSIQITDNYAYNSVERTFATLDAGLFVKYRLGRHVWATYSLIWLHSFANTVVENNVRYSVASAVITTNHEARTVADGSARHHGFGLQYRF